MTLTINTDVLKKYDLSLGQFIVLLTGYYNIDYQEANNELIKRGLAQKDLFKGFPPVLSDNTKALIARIIVASSEKVINSGIDFSSLAEKLMNCYPNGTKPGTTHSWRGTKPEIEDRLMMLVYKYNAVFTEKEAIDAVTQYVSRFKNQTYMSVLKNLLLTVKKDGSGQPETESIFMTIIENTREQNEENND